MSTDLDIRSGLLGHNTAFTVMFQDLYGKADPGPYGTWTETVNATGQGEQKVTIAFLTNLPLLALWDGARTYGNLRNYTQSITYNKYAATLPLKRDLVMNDKSGLVARAITGFVAGITDAYDQLTAASFDGSSGAGPTGFDGVALFSASHPDGPAAATQSNLAAATSLSHAALVSAEQAGILLVEENSRPLRIQYDLLRVGPKLKRRAQELVSADRAVIVNTDGVMDLPRAVTSTASVAGVTTRSSVWQGDMTVLVDPRVTNYYWTLQDTKKPAKPMTMFVVRAPEPQNQTDMNDPERFNHDNFVYGVEADLGIAAGHWAVVYRGTGTD